MEEICSNLRNKITFGDFKLADIPKPCVGNKSCKRFKIKLHYYSLSSGLKAVKAAKKVGVYKIIGVTVLTSLIINL